MDDLTADVLDIISAEWLKQASHPEAMVVLTADDFLRHRGINPKKGGTGRRGGYHNHLRQEIARHIDILTNTWIRVFEREVTVVSEGKRGPERKRVKWAGESRAIIVSSRVGPVNPSGDIEPRAWKIRPGDVFAQFLIGPGRQTALVSQMALHYDPYRQYWEKRITRFLAYLWRIRGGRNDYLAPISVEALLQGAGLQISNRNPKKSRRSHGKGTRSTVPGWRDQILALRTAGKREASRSKGMVEGMGIMEGSNRAAPGDHGALQQDESYPAGQKGVAGTWKMKVGNHE